MSEPLNTSTPRAADAAAADSKRSGGADNPGSSRTGAAQEPLQADSGDSASLKPSDNGRNPAAGDLPNSAVDLSSADPSSAPGMPHERDETVGMTGGIPSERVEKAFADVEEGRQDTSRGIEADQTYQRQKKESGAANR